MEYQLDGISQMQVNKQIGFDFSNGLRHILRQDPDIIMVGEIRDRETAEIAIHAALTGHLVLSTLHTNDAPSAITRLMDMGIQQYLLSSTLRAVVAQRLVRVLCKECLGEGCDSCRDIGYKGRTGIYEMLSVTKEIQGLMLKRSADMDIRERSDMKSLYEDGMSKVRLGITSKEEVLRVTRE